MQKRADQVAIQGRVYADNPDQAALMARQKHPEYDGKLSIYRALGGYGEWYEYIITKEVSDNAKES